MKIYPFIYLNVISQVDHGTNNNLLGKFLSHKFKIYTNIIEY